MSRGTTLRRDGAAHWWRRAADLWRRTAGRRYLKRVERFIRKGEPHGRFVTLGNARAVMVLVARYRRGGRDEEAGS